MVLLFACMHRPLRFVHGSRIWSHAMWREFGGGPDRAAEGPGAPARDPLRRSGSCPTYAGALLSVATRDRADRRCDVWRNGLAWRGAWAAGARAGADPPRHGAITEMLGVRAVPACRWLCGARRLLPRARQARCSMRQELSARRAVSVMRGSGVGRHERQTCQEQSGQEERQEPARRSRHAALPSWPVRGALCGEPKAQETLQDTYRHDTPCTGRWACLFRLWFTQHIDMAIVIAGRDADRREQGKRHGH